MACIFRYQAAVFQCDCRVCSIVFCFSDNHTSECGFVIISQSAECAVKCNIFYNLVICISHILVHIFICDFLFTTDPLAATIRIFTTFFRIIIIMRLLLFPVQESFTASDNPTGSGTASFYIVCYCNQLVCGINLKRMSICSASIKDVHNIHIDFYLMILFTFIFCTVLKHIRFIRFKFRCFLCRPRCFRILFIHINICFRLACIIIPMLLIFIFHRLRYLVSIRCIMMCPCLICPIICEIKVINSCTGCSTWIAEGI